MDNTDAQKRIAKDDKPHWAVTELASLVILGCALYAGWAWHNAGSFDGMLESANYHFREQHWHQAIPLFEKLIVARRSLRKPENLDLAKLEADLAHCYFNVDQDKKAEPLLEKALSIREKLMKPDDVEMAKNLYELAYCYSEDKKYPQSIALYKRSIPIYEKKGSSSDAAYALEGLAFVYYSQQQYSDAISNYEAAGSVNRFVSKVES